MAWHKKHTLRVAQVVLTPLALFYSWNMISTGLYVTGHIVVPQNIVTESLPVIGTAAGIAALFALVLVIAEGVLFLALPSLFYRSKRKWHWKLITATIGLGLVGYITFQSLTGVSFNAHGDDLVQHKEQQLSSYISELHDIDRKIESNFMGQLSSLDTLAERANDGKDNTGLTGCGNNCKGYINKHSRQRETFEAFLGESGRVITDSELSQTPNIGLVHSKLAGITEKSQIYRAWADQSGLTAAAVPLITRLNNITNKVDEWGGGAAIAPNKTSLSIGYAEATFAALASFTLSSEQALRIMTTLIPELVLMLMGAAIAINSRAQSLMEEALDIEEETEALERATDAYAHAQARKSEYTAAYFAKKMEDKYRDDVDKVH